MVITKQPLISILVPCYNVEKYLEQCLDSIVNQTLKDIEIICINDGSTDSTLDIIKSYAKSDKRIVIIDKQNEGYGKSMNRGLDAATGKYIGIVESDDWVDSNMFQELTDIAEKHNVDVVKSNFYRFTKDSEEINILPEHLSLNDLNKKIIPRKNTGIFFTQPSIWSAIYKREFLNNNNIRFLETPGASYQDTGFIFKVLVMSEQIWITDKTYLHYRCDNENSSVKSTNKIFCVYDEFKSVEDYLKQHNMLTKDIITLINHVKLGSYFWNLKRLTGNARKEFAKLFASEYKEHKLKKQINNDYMDDIVFLRLQKILHPYNAFYPILLAIINIINPIYKTRIKNGQKIRYILNCIPVYKKYLY